MYDLRNQPKTWLVDFIVENKKNSHTLAEGTDADVRTWAEGKDREFLVEICAGWNKDSLIKAGLRSA
jgi:hypothetical protein